MGATLFKGVWRTIKSLCMMAVMMTAIFFMITTYQLRAPLKLERPIAFVIEPGVRVTQVLEKIQEKGVAPRQDDLYGFALGQRLFLRLVGWDEKFQSGEYWLRPGEHLMKVYEKFVNGADHVLHPLTIPEGLTTAQILDVVREAEFLEGALPVLVEPLFLLPETYHFQRGTGRREVVARLQAEGSKMLQQVWEKRALETPLVSPKDLLVLASIVEKETRLPQERSLVAQAFHNRLRQRMPLQADPTVSYGLHIMEKRPLEQPLSRADLKKTSPYNTYTIQGLPPHAICHPGIEALRATAQPQEGELLYFVADGSGGHVFSATYKKHAVHHQNWRKLTNGSGRK